MQQTFGYLIPDKNQQQAIEHVGGPMLVLAGAGTGKTTVLTHRIKNLIEGGHASPEQILAVTYTVNSAAELVRRLKTKLSVPCEGLNSSNFHEYCFALLKRSKRQFELVDEKDLWVYLRQRIESLELKHFIVAGDLGKFLEDLLDFFRRCHDEMVSPDDYDAYVARLVKGEIAPPRVAKSRDADVMAPAEAIARCREIARVYRKVEQMLAADGLGTFGHMISEAVRLLETDKDVLAREQKRTRFILIDEFQDSNLAQVRLAKLLAGAEGNVFAVGDPDQAIYRFRGATSGAFDLFLRYFGREKVKTVNLVVNRRSTQKILDCACVSIADNPDVVSAQSGVNFKRERLISAREQQALERGEKVTSEPVEFVVTPDSRTEAVEIAQGILSLRAATNCEWEDFAVLYRNHWSRTELAQELQELDIPFVVKGVKVDGSTPVRDLTAALRAILGMDDSVAMFRLAALPKFGIDPQELRAALAAGRRRTPLSAVLRNVEGGDRLLKAVEQARALAATADDRAVAAVDAAIGSFGLPGEVAELRAFRAFVEQWHKKPEIVRGTHSLESFLTYLDRFYEAKGTVCVPDPPEDAELPDAVRLMTVHAAKGLEFKHVFVLKAQGSFPSGYRESLVDFPQEVRDAQTIAEGNAKELHKEEERRLFYVALTRAKDVLKLVAKKGTGKKDLRPSGFARDMHDSVQRLSKVKATGPEMVVRFTEAARVPEMAAEAVSTPLQDWVMLPPRAALHEMKLSASAIETYRRCPLQFKLERDWNIPGETTASLLYGAAMHSALRAYFEARKNGKQVGHDELFRCFKSQFEESAIGEEYQWRLLEQQASEQITAFLNSPEAASTAEVIATEMSFDVQIGGIRVAGRIDRLDRIADDRVAVVDYKTGRPKSQEDADKSLQLSVYALALRETGLKPESLRLYNLQDQTSIAATRGEEQLKVDREIIQSVAVGITNGEFEATPNQHCDWCAYNSICPEKEEASVPVAMSFKAKSVQ